MIFDQWSFVDLFAKFPAKFFLWIQTNNWLSTYLHEEDWHKTGRKLSDEQAGARWPGQWPQFDWDKRETMARFSKQQHPLEFCDQIKRGKVVKKKPGFGMQHWISSLLATGWCPTQLKSGADAVEAKRWHHLLVVRRQGWIIRVGFGRSRSPKTSKIVVCNILKYGQTNCRKDRGLEIARFPCNFVLQKRDWLVRMEVGNLVWPGTNRRQGFLQLSVH